MIDQTTSKTKRRSEQEPLSAAGVAIVRIVNDLLFFVLALVAIFNVDSGGFVMGIRGPVLTALIDALILLGSITAFLLIRRGFSKLGRNVLIYSLIFGMFINSIFFENVGSFGLVVTLFFTMLTISSDFSFKEAVPPITVTIIFGVTGLAFDTYFEGAAFRSPPAFGMTSTWVPTAFFALLILYLMARQFPIFSLRAKLISSFIVVTLLSLSLMVLFNLVSLQQILTGEADQALFAAASQTAASIEDFLSNHAQTIESLATLPSIVDYTANPLRTRTKDVADLLRSFSSQESDTVLSYSIIDTDGNVISDTDPENVGRPAENFGPFFETMQSVNTIITDVLYDAALDAPVIYISTPIKERNVSTIGIIRVKLHASFIQELVERSNGLVGRDSFPVLFDEYFIHLAHGTHPETLFSTVAPLENDLFERLIAEGRLPNRGRETLFLNLLDLESSLNLAKASTDGVSYFDATDVATGDRVDRGAVVKVARTPWLLVFFQPKDIFLQPLTTLGNSSIFFLIISGLFATGIGFGLTQVIVRPIALLNETATQISEGDFSARSEITTQDEIGTLGNTFNMMTIQLQNLIVNLESQVADRTKELQDQTLQLMATAEIARDATSENELKFLLERAAYLLYDRFDFYHVGIYQIDEPGQYAILTSSQDPQGLQLIANGHKYLIDSESSVGRAIALGTAQLANIKNGSEGNHHPLLLESQSQLSLPLQVAGKSIGVIDIHSSNPDAFSVEEIGIFSTFSDQIAIAIQRTEFSQEIQATLNELESAYGQFTQDSWRGFIQGKMDQFSGYRFRRLAVEPLDEQPEEVTQAWEAGETISMTHEKDGTGIMAIPLKVRGEVIGVLDLEFESELIPPDTRNLMTEIAERLSLVLENARLIESAQEQVERQQLAAQLTERISQSLDLDTVLSTASREIGEALGLAEVEIRLGSLDLGFQMSDNGDGTPAAPPSPPPPPNNPGQGDFTKNEDDYEPIH